MVATNLKSCNTCLIILTKFLKLLNNAWEHSFGTSMRNSHLSTWFQDCHVNLIMEPSTTVNGTKTGLEKGEEPRSGRMAANTLATGKMTKLIVKAD